MAIFGVLSTAELPTVRLAPIIRSFNRRACRCLESFELDGAAFAVVPKPLAAATRDGYGTSRNGRLDVVFSGEIVNRQELCRLDKINLGDTHSDATLFAELYQAYACDSIRRISGQFCAAAWEHDSRTLTLLLDRVGGIKNLYYSMLHDGFVFGTELAAMSRVFEQLSLNPLEVRGLLSTGYVLPPNTLLEGVFKMSPGEAITYRAGRMSRRMVDRVMFSSDGAHEGSADALIERLDRALAILSEEPETSFLLSGGIDSSVLVALTAQHLGESVQTFTAAFADPQLDESSFAAMVADKNRCGNERILLGSDDLLDDLPQIVSHLGEPFLDDSVIPTFHLFRHIKDRTEIIVSGDGPDHLFYRYYPLAAKRHVYAKYTNGCDMVAAFPHSPARKVQSAGTVSLAEAYRGIFAGPTWGDFDGWAGLLGPSLRSNSVGEQVRSYYEALQVPLEVDLQGRNDAVGCVDFYVDGSFGVFWKIGRMADAHQLLVREPYLDRDVTDFIATLPLHQRQRGCLIRHLLGKTDQKYLLKRGIGSHLLPKEVLAKKKGGFTPPLRQWLASTLGSLPKERLLSSTIREGGLLDVKAVEALVQEHVSGRRDWSSALFLVLTFDLWIRMFLESRGGDHPHRTLREIYGR